MQPSPTSTDILSDLSGATSVVVLLPKNPTFEVVASGLGLFLSLERAGKQVSIICASPMLVDVNQLVGVQRVKNKLPGRNLVISFNYAKDAIEKVSYNVENGKFNLVVVPKAGHPPLDHTQVEYSHTGSNGDVTILVGSRDVHEADGDLLGLGAGTDRRIFSLIAGPDRTLIAETALLVSNLGIVPDADTANNLFLGLVRETQQFKTAAAADFETAAALVRAGATPPPPSTTELPQVKERTVPVMNESIQTNKSDWLKQPKIFSTRDEQ